eukprot:Rhum_TRINITY_DN23385_c0_g1::Rhum_TRINITY_DN23385_c0_g1_i1::g.177852::m.177852
MQPCVFLLVFFFFERTFRAALCCLVSLEDRFLSLVSSRDVLGVSSSLFGLRKQGDARVFIPASLHRHHMRQVLAQETLLRRNSSRRRAGCSGRAVTPARRVRLLRFADVLLGVCPLDLLHGPLHVAAVVHHVGCDDLAHLLRGRFVLALLLQRQHDALVRRHGVVVDVAVTVLRAHEDLVEMHAPRHLRHRPHADRDVRHRRQVLRRQQHQASLLARPRVRTRARRQHAVAVPEHDVGVVVEHVEPCPRSHRSLCVPHVPHLHAALLAARREEAAVEAAGDAGDAVARAVCVDGEAGTGEGAVARPHVDDAVAAARQDRLAGAVQVGKGAARLAAAGQTLAVDDDLLLTLRHLLRVPQADRAVHGGADDRVLVVGAPLGGGGLARVAKRLLLLQHVYVAGVELGQLPALRAEDDGPQVRHGRDVPVARRREAQVVDGIPFVRLVPLLRAQQRVHRHEVPVVHLVVHAARQQTRPLVVQRQRRHRLLVPRQQRLVRHRQRHARLRHAHGALGRHAVLLVPPRAHARDLVRRRRNGGVRRRTLVRRRSLLQRRAELGAAGLRLLGGGGAGLFLAAEAAEAHHLCHVSVHGAAWCCAGGLKPPREPCVNEVQIL